MGNHSNAMWARRRERRGWLTAILGGAAAVQQTGILTPTNKADAARFAEALAKYQLAIQGDAMALCFIKHMSGQFGQGNCPNPTAGYATAEAKAYSGKLYQQALQVLQGQLPPGVPAPTSPQSSPTPPVNVQYTGGSGGGLTIQGGGTTFQSGTGAPQTQEQRTQSTMLWVLGAVVVLGGAAFFIMRKR